MFTQGRPSVTRDPAGNQPVSSCRHRHANRLGVDGGVVGDVIFVTKEKLERMVSEWKRDLRLRLPRAKMQVIEIIGNRSIHRRQWGVHNEVMMACIGFFDAGGRYPHVDEAKAYGQPMRDVGSVGGVDEINLGIGSGGMSEGGAGYRGSVGDPHVDALGHHRWRVRNVPAISQQELKRMLSGGQAYLSLCLAGSKVEVREVAWDWSIQRWQIGIDQKMVMSGILMIGAGRCHSHATKPKMNDRLGRQRVAILDVNEINGGARRGGSGPTTRWHLAIGNRGRRHPD
jgi:hypothetical protein